MAKILKSFKYNELGSVEKTKAFEIISDDLNNYILHIKGDKKDYPLKAKDVEEIFNKYSFNELTIDNAYPFPIKEQIDYRLEGYFLNPSDNFDLNGYSHFPIFFNDFITDLARLINSKSLFKFKAKEEMLDKDLSYKTNYIEKCSIYGEAGKIIIAVDKVTTFNYEVDVAVNELDAYFKINDLSFILPANVSFFTYYFNKVIKLTSKALKRNVGLENYIDVRLKNKKHRYYDLNDLEVKEALNKLINFLNMFIKIPILKAFVDDKFIEAYKASHKRPKNKAEVAKDYSDLINHENFSTLDALKKVAKDNPNLEMSQIVSIAYKLQDAYFVYLIDDKNIKEIKVLDLDKREKKLLKYYNESNRIDVSYLDLSKDYDAHFYKENNLIHLKIVASRYPELEYLKIDNKLKSLIQSYFLNKWKIKKLFKS